MRATDQAISHPVSAKVAGLRNETGPDTGPPVITRAAMCTTMVMSRTVPVTHNASATPE
jgi:hypothetical protein